MIQYLLALFNLLVLHMIRFSGVCILSSSMWYSILRSIWANPTPSAGEMDLYAAVLQGQWIERNHCLIENHCGIVTLRPVPGARCSVNGSEVSGSCRLSQGKACFSWEWTRLITAVWNLWNLSRSTKHISLLPAPQGLLHELGQIN